MLLLVAALVCSAGQPSVSWSETLAVARIHERHPVSLLPSDGPEPPDRARAHVCFTIGGAGEVVSVKGACGDAALLAAVTRSLKQWRFAPPEPDPTYGNSVTTELTFQWRDHGASLIWDRHDYPIGKKDAAKLVRAVPRVAAEMKDDPRLILEVDSYPQERDGIFYLFHLYEVGKSLTFTLGWYEVNAYSGEVWDGLQFQPIRARGIRRLRKRLGLGASPYEGLKPWITETDELLRNPCADRPRPRRRSH